MGTIPTPPSWAAMASYLRNTAASTAAARAARWASSSSTSASRRTRAASYSLTWARRRSSAASAAPRVRGAAALHLLQEGQDLVLVLLPGPAERRYLSLEALQFLGVPDPSSVEVRLR